MSQDEIVNQRKNKFLKIGRDKGFISNPDELSSLNFQGNKIEQIFKSKKIIFSVIFILLSVLTSLFFIL
jgi:acetyl-CoA carboxylase carboxyl transferase subunit alpha